ncbi:hypothetical protein HDU92_008703 [Lobulomyces angularis]|nr:hypothetical protein HDU92_008703 [Lobulomyces angularis]
MNASLNFNSTNNGTIDVSDQCVNGYHYFNNTDTLTFFLCNDLERPIVLGIDGVAFLTALWVFLFSSFTINRKKHTITTLDKLILVAEFIWMLKTFLYIFLDIFMIEVIPKDLAWGWPVWDLINLFAEAAGSISVFMFEVLIIERFFLVAKAFYKLPNFIYWTLMLVSVFVTSYDYNGCWFTVDVYGEEALSEFCISMKWEDYDFSRVAGTINIWFKTILDTFTGLWIIISFMKSGKIGTLFKKIRKENTTKSRKVTRVRNGLLKFLLSWLGLLWFIIIVYMINQTPMVKLYSLDDSVNVRIVNLVDSALNILRSLEVILYFKYMNQLKALLLIRKIEVPKTSNILSSLPQQMQEYPSNNAYTNNECSELISLKSRAT